MPAGDLVSPLSAFRRVGHTEAWRWQIRGSSPSLWELSVAPAGSLGGPGDRRPRKPGDGVLSGRRTC